MHPRNLMLMLICTLAALLLAGWLGVVRPSPRHAAPATCWDAVRQAATPRAKAHAAGAYFGLPWGLVAAVVDVENTPWDPSAVNPESGAVGLGQVMPETVADKRRIPATEDNLASIRAELKDPSVNLCWAARILRDAAAVCTRHGLSSLAEIIPCALAGYEAGPRRSRYIARILGARPWE